jgi:pimeloyl-ACP methyl ester carboxylesterase
MTDESLADHSSPSLSDAPPYELGGSGRPLHLAHANGYPPPVYRQLVEPLAEHARVFSLRFGPLRPGTDPAAMHRWSEMAEDLVAYLDAEHMRGVIGVGHSLGGVLTMYAALRRPERFRALILIEPVFLPPELLTSVDTAERAAERIGLVRIARQRREQWPSPAAAFEHFRSKPVFAGLSDEAMWDYVNGGLKRVDGGAEEDGPVELAYPRDWEARIYSTPPLDVWQAIPRISVPTLAIRGAETDTISLASWRRWQDLQPDATFLNMAGVGHLLPFEAPERVAAEIERFVLSLQ